MARVALAGLGGLPWVPKVPGQKGLRILTLDGGGTRGVLSIAYLKEILKRVNSDLEPYQMFDLICGTSTGGIIACLLGAQRASLASTEVLYDEFIEKVFGQRSNLRLVTDRAAYDEAVLEKILYDMCGDQLMVDTQMHSCANVFCISSQVNANPCKPNIWRNYNYPPGQKSRYPGSCRVNTFTAVRATSAAPTFFTPVPWENGLYVDGALVANNPTAVATQEAKMLYPGVPIEMIVSIGTGYVNELKQIDTMGWDLLVNQLVASSTGTEDTHALLTDLLPKDMYFRFNPQLTVDYAIDEKDKGILAGMKKIARDDVASMETGPGRKEFELMIKMLKGSSR
ncbi:acyl transferase/acyl hydrolase/lysophospholipase [Ochromonadaceae sp. CCMP2298]|nr:acyl transferase/acyl hydrolase/lysophospholipase [Ochromonadaceae sp. CCMP2298]